jgi:hypothetical protein
MERVTTKVAIRDLAHAKESVLNALRNCNTSEQETLLTALADIETAILAAGDGGGRDETVADALCMEAMDLVTRARLLPGASRARRAQLLSVSRYITNARHAFACGASAGPRPWFSWVNK